MFKRILIITIVLVLIAFGVWYFLSTLPQTEAPQTGSRFEFPTQEERQTNGGSTTSIENSDNEQTETTTGAQDTIILPEETTGFIEEGVLVTQITDKRVAGGYSFGTKDTLDLSLRYVEKETGHVYEYIFDENAIRKLTGNNIPGINEALWVDENKVVVRYKDDGVLKTFAGEIIQEEEGEGMLVGNFLTNNISQITLASPDVIESDLFYLTENENGSTGYVSDFEGQNAVRVFSSPIKEWLIDWPSRFLLSLNTKPSGNVPGFAYEVESTSRLSTDVAFINILKNKNGLLTLQSPDGERVFYSEKKGGNLTSGFMEKDLAKEIEADVQTLPEKCVWSGDNVHIYCGAPETLPSGNYPDDWYAGLSQFSDNVFRINSETGTTDVLLVTGFDIQEEIDAVDLFLSEEEDYLFFRNKRDDSLWMMSLPSF